jgi:predicted nucleic acid-binding protein
MATTAASPVFVDTNVLVYTRVAAPPLHAIAISALDQLRASGVELWTSRQVLREYLAATTRPGTITPAVPTADLVADVQGFLTRFMIAEDGPRVTAHLLNLLGSVACQGKQVHDANIVATMQAHGIPNLLTHNTGDFARFSTYITVVPLVAPAPPPGGPASPGSTPPPGVP